MARKAQSTRRNLAPPPLTEREKRAFLKQRLAIIAKIEPKKIDPDPSKTVEDLLRLNFSELSIDERRYVAEALRQQWLPKHELRAYRQQHRLEQIEAMKFMLKHFSKQTAAERKETVRKFHDFPTAKAMKQFEKRERAKRRRR